MHEEGAKAGVATKLETSKAAGHGREMRKSNRCVESNVYIFFWHLLTRCIVNVWPSLLCTVK